MAKQTDQQTNKQTHASNESDFLEIFIYLWLNCSLQQTFAEIAGKFESDSPIKWIGSIRS